MKFEWWLNVTPGSDLWAFAWLSKGWTSSNEIHSCDICCSSLELLCSLSLVSWRKNAVSSSQRAFFLTGSSGVSLNKLMVISALSIRLPNKEYSRLVSHSSSLSDVIISLLWSAPKLLAVVHAELGPRWGFKLSDYFHKSVPAESFAVVLRLYRLRVRLRQRSK